MNDAPVDAPRRKRTNSRPMTPDEEQAIVEKYKERDERGKRPNGDTIAALFGRSKSTIVAILRKHEVIRSRPKRALAPNIQHKIVRAHVQQGMTRGQIATELGIARETVSRTLDSAGIEKFVQQGKERLVQAIPQAAEVVVASVVNERDVENAKWLLEKTGVTIRGNEQENRNSGGITFNVALFDPSRAGELLARIAERSRPALLDAELHDDQGRTEQPFGTDLRLRC